MVHVEKRGGGYSDHGSDRRRLDPALHLARLDLLDWGLEEAGARRVLVAVAQTHQVGAESWELGAHTNIDRVARPRRETVGIAQ